MIGEALDEVVDPIAGLAHRARRPTRRRDDARFWIQLIALGIALATLYYGLVGRVDSLGERIDGRLQLLEYRITQLEKRIP